MIITSLNSLQVSSEVKGLVNYKYPHPIAHTLVKLFSILHRIYYHKTIENRQDFRYGLFLQYSLTGKLEK